MSKDENSRWAHIVKFMKNDQDPVLEHRRTGPHGVGQSSRHIPDMYRSGVHAGPKPRNGCGTRVFNDSVTLSVEWGS